MMKKKSDSLRTSENRRVSPYGEYYISVKKIEMFRDEREDCESLYSSPPRLPYLQPSLGYHMLIRAVFESDKKYFGKTSKERWVHNIPLSTNAYTIRQNPYHFDVSIYFPSLTTLNIIKGKRFIRLLLEDAEIYEALLHLLIDLNNMSIPDLPGTPPTSMLESFLRRQIVDTETRLKLQIDYPIAFEDIEGAQNMEIREQALRKFGYERYVEEGWGKRSILTILTNEEILMGPKHKMYNSSLYEESRIKTLIKHTKEECIIYMDNEISFLKVRDASTKEIYFLKIPPDIADIQEAKAWTFGLKKEEYNPVVET